MRKKLYLLAAIDLLFIMVMFFTCWKISLALIILSLLTGICGLSFLVLNKLFKKTNYWKNLFDFQKRFVSNEGYRDNISRNYDIINLGSNPAMFAFFYEQVRGQNWSTGSQGLSMDFEILKYFHSYLRDGGIVLIPIMPFTAISQYLKNKPEYWSDNYYMKFASILDGYQANHLNGAKNYLLMLKCPLLYNIKGIKYLFHDVERDHRLEIAEQPMQALDMEQDARLCIQSWMKEFDVTDMEAFYSDKFAEYYEEGTQILRDMINYCLERNYKPVIITIPMTSYLGEMFNEEFRQKMVKDFVSKANEKDVLFLDYWNQRVFTDSSLYFNSFYFNLRGRKLFTAQVLKELGLMS